MQCTWYCVPGNTWDKRDWRKNTQDFYVQYNIYSDKLIYITLLYWHFISLFTYTTQYGSIKVPKKFVLHQLYAQCFSVLFLYIHKQWNKLHVSENVSSSDTTIYNFTSCWCCIILRSRISVSNGIYLHLFVTFFHSTTTTRVDLKDERLNWRRRESYV